MSMDPNDPKCDALLSRVDELQKDASKPRATVEVPQAATVDLDKAIDSFPMALRVLVMDAVKSALEGTRVDLDVGDHEAFRQIVREEIGAALSGLTLDQMFDQTRKAVVEVVDAVNPPKAILGDPVQATLEERVIANNYLETLGRERVLDNTTVEGLAGLLRCIDRLSTNLADILERQIQQHIEKNLPE